MKAYAFDNKHQATFYRSNDNWQQGREISWRNMIKIQGRALIMAETTIGSEVKNTNQRFTYTYDFHKVWNFLIELINVSKEADSRQEYPAVVRSEGIGPKQYGTKGLLGDKFADIEEKYDLTRGAEGFNEKNEEGEDMGIEESADEYQDEED
ncbi:plasmid pRiA4b ORF-3 family protein [Niabella sp. W65]|nr:plasmid pRiA4b ORF-3 family protein [Niabella sp. W65]MCH7361497.1 plasmid pRiA4b ORF-3 family protein [Niabella sp. W65]